MAELKYSPLLAQTRLLWFHWTKKWLPSENSTFLPVFYRPIWTFFINLTSLSFNCFLKADGEISYKEGLMKSQIFGPRCFRDLLPLTVEATSCGSTGCMGVGLILNVLIFVEIFTTDQVTRKFWASYRFSLWKNACFMSLLYVTARMTTFVFLYYLIQGKNASVLRKKQQDINFHVEQQYYPSISTTLTTL